MSQLELEDLIRKCLDEFYRRQASLLSTLKLRDILKLEELCKAINRLEHDFLINFGNVDGSINWARLLQFNSGKE